MVNTSVAGGTPTRGACVVTAANNGTSLALSAGTIPASGSCTVTVNVTSAAAGSYLNNTGRDRKSVVEGKRADPGARGVRSQTTGATDFTASLGTPNVAS